MDVEHQIRGAGVAVLIREGVGKGLGGIRGQCLEGGIVGVEGVGISTVRPQNQGAVGASKGTAGNGAGRWAGGYAVGALDVVVQHIAGQRRQRLGGGLGVAVVFGRWHIVDDVHVQGVGGCGAVAVHQGNGEVFPQAVGAGARGVGFVVVEGVGVGDHASRRVVPGDGQGITQVGGKHLWESRCHAAGDYVDTAHGQGLYAVECGDGEGATLSQRAAAWRRAVAQGVFIEGQFGAFDFEAVEGRGVVVVVDVEHQVGGTGVAVRVGEGVGEGFGAATIALEGQKRRARGVEGIGVAAIGRQHEGAVGAGVGAGRHRAAGHAVGALYVVGQHVAGEGQLAFGADAGVAVVGRVGQVVGDVDVQRAGGGVAVGVAGHHRELFVQVVGAVGR